MLLEIKMKEKMKEKMKKEIKGTRNLGDSGAQIFESEIDYILHRPSLYLGSTEEEMKSLYMYNGDELVLKEVHYNQAIFKCINEIIENALDEGLKTDFKFSNKIEVLIDDDFQITVSDNGRGIPIQLDKVTNKYIPELLFSELKSGSNFDDDSNLISTGTHGVGASLVNIFSSRFEVQVYDGINKFKQVFSTNLKNRNKPIVQKSNKPSGTTIKFNLDFNYFKTSDSLKSWIKPIVLKRLRDLSLVFPKIKFKFNKKNVTIKKPVDILKKIDPNVIFVESDKVRLGLFLNEDNANIGFVNGLNTPEGSHINYVVTKVVTHLREYIIKKNKLTVKPTDIRNFLGIFLSIQFPNPKFDHQTKEVLSSNPKDFSYLIDEVLTNKIIAKFIKHPKLIPTIVNTFSAKEKVKNNSNINKTLKTRKRISKYIPPINKQKSENILLISEGDSASSGIMGVRKRNSIHGIYPLKGKVLNVYDEDTLKIVSNEELKNLMQIIGLSFDVKADNINFKKISIFADMDVDGNSITGLLLNFFAKFWPELIDRGIITRIISPLALIKHKSKSIEIFSYSDLKNWELKHMKEKYTVHYYKGLGSLSSELYEKAIYDGTEYVFSNCKDSDKFLKIVYSKSCADERKKWINKLA